MTSASTTTAPGVAKPAKPYVSSVEEIVSAFNAIMRPGVPSFFDLKAQLPSYGRTDTPIAATSHLTVMLKCYAAGGENTLHAHVNEDHVFLVLQGTAKFMGPQGEMKTVGRNGGVMLPHGTLYSFVAGEEETLVLLRIGCPSTEGADVYDRVGITGAPMAGDSAENKQVEPILSDRWFGGAAN